MDDKIKLRYKQLKKNLIKVDINKDNKSYPGMDIHEMGTARMGRDPRRSVLNDNNQLHAVPNVFVTDGAAMISASCVNPSLKNMALKARVADFTVREMEKSNI